MKLILLVIFTLSLYGANGEVLFQKCISCHGEKAELRAMGSSKVIKSWNALKLEKVLIGYRQGTYGFCFKSLMREQVKFLSNDEIRAVSLYISKL